MSGHIAITGGGGFLGWHTRAAFREHSGEVIPIAVGDSFDEGLARGAVSGAKRVVHIAGVNRAPDAEVRDGNVRFAQQLADSIARSEDAPGVVVFANSTQAGNGSAYGESKARASEILADAASAAGADFIDVRLPNLFGEHGRPFYNSVAATFSQILAEGGEPVIDVDRELTLLHAQDAADLLTGKVAAERQPSLEVRESVSGLLARLTDIATTYRAGEVPDVSVSFGRDLFNTYRSFAFSTHAPITLLRHEDSRGAFFETVRSRGGATQSSFSTTEPGVSRGDHFHRRKVERFTVLSGSAVISLRRLFADDVVRFEVTGDEPVAVDMPTLWAHNIVNTGPDPLFTSFWANEMFDPSSPDTIPEVV